MGGSAAQRFLGFLTLNSVAALMHGTILYRGRFGGVRSAFPPCCLPLVPCLPAKRWVFRCACSALQFWALPLWLQRHAGGISLLVIRMKPLTLVCFRLLSDRSVCAACSLCGWLFAASSRCGGNHVVCRRSRPNTFRLGVACSFGLGCVFLCPGSTCWQRPRFGCCLFVLPSTWITLATWVAAAAVSSALCGTGNRAFCTLGMVFAGALEVGAIVAGSLADSAGTTLLANPLALVPVIAALVVAIALTCTAAPRAPLPMKGSSGAISSLPLCIYGADASLEGGIVYICKDEVCDPCCDFCWYCIHGKYGQPAQCEKDESGFFGRPGLLR